MNGTSLINLISSIFVVVAIVYLFFTVSKTKGDLKKALTLISVGILIGIGLHSIVELIESIGVIGVDALVKTMPILLLIGSIPLLYGTYVLYKIIKSKAS